MEISQMLYYAITGEKKEYTAAALILIIIALGYAGAYFLAINPDCAQDAQCFKKALLECRHANMQFNESFPLEGAFSYNYSIIGKDTIPKVKEGCNIAFSLAITPPDAKNSTLREGACRLQNYKNIGQQFEWDGVEQGTLSGECLRLERKLNGN